jgi:general secretion pathway protein G
MAPKVLRKNLGRRAFSLVEIMVVVVIIGILAAAVVGKVVGEKDKAMVKRAAGDLATLDTQLERFYLDMDRYPTSDEGLAALLDAPEDDEDGKWQGPYVKKLSKDPWGREYIYESPGTENEGSYDLQSYGRDGEEGGEGFDADIKAWTDETEEDE